MNPSTLIVLVIGLVLPLVTSAVTKAGVPARVKVLVLLFLSTAAGVVSGLVSSPPAGWSAWEHVLLNVVAAFLAAAAADYQAWSPLQTKQAIAARTAGFGVGKV